MRLPKMAERTVNMTGLDMTTEKQIVDAANEALLSTADISREQMAAYIARAHQMRSAHIANWGRQIVRTWTSLWRRPLMIPQTIR